MNKILLNYILFNFLKTFFTFVLIFYIFGIILNLFEEVEFFKNINVSMLTPILLTSIYIPSLIIKILPFVIFFSSMWFMVRIRNNKNLLILKVHGYSNLKIFFILAFTSFFLGWFILFIINPISSSMSKYYEKTKSNYSKKIDHLITFNKNGLWMKETINGKNRIITATKPNGNYLLDTTIFHIDEKSNLVEKIFSEKVNVKNNNWKLKNAFVFKEENGILVKKMEKDYEIKSIYNLERINNLFKNFDTLSFIDLVFNYNKLEQIGYSKSFLDQGLHKKLSLPFFLFLMTGIASILTFNSLTKSNNLRFVMIGIIVSIIIFYLNDLSLALGQTEKISLALAIWSPILALSLISFIGVLQINEK